MKDSIAAIQHAHVNSDASARLSPCCWSSPSGRSAKLDETSFPLQNWLEEQQPLLVVVSSSGKPQDNSSHKMNKKATPEKRVVHRNVRSLYVDMLS